MHKLCDKLEPVFLAIDTINQADPILAEFEGQLLPRAQIYSRQMSAWLSEMDANPSSELQVACRAQHIARWQSERSDYPLGRQGYKKWRSELLVFHARTTAELLAQIQIEAESIQRVSELILKKNRTGDRESQALEDVACLVFLAHQFASFAEKHSEVKTIGILQKTWAKMSEKAQARALQIPFQDRALALIQGALT